jgi:PAS domain S-box-containing protein
VFYISDGLRDSLVEGARRLNCSLEEFLSRLLEGQSRPILEHTTDVIARFDRDFRHLYINRAIEQFTGLSPDVILGKTVGELGSSDHHARRWNDYLKAVFETGGVQETEFSYPTPAGNRYFHTKFVPEYDAAGSIETVLSISRDITDLKNAQDQLFQINHAIEAADTGVVIADATLADTPIIYVNSGFERMTGYSRDEVKGKNCRFLQGDDRDQPELEVLREMLNAARPGKVLLRNYRKDGTLFWNELRITPIFSQGSLTHFIGIQNDVTAQKQADDAVRTSKAELQAIFDSGFASIVVIDENYRIIASNKIARDAGFRVFGKKMTSGESFFDFVFPQDVEGFRANFQRALKGEVVAVEKAIPSPVGKLIFKFMYQPVTDDCGNVTGVCFLSYDVTESRLAQQQLYESQQLYQSLVDVLPMSLYRTDQNRRLTFVNRAILEALNTTQEAVLGRTAADFYPSHLAEKYYRDDLYVLMGNTLRLVEEHISPVDGQKQYVEVIKTPLRDQDGSITGIQGLFWDVTDRILTEQKLRKSEDRYRTISELGSDFAFSYQVTEDGRVVREWMTESFVRVTGYSLEDLENTIPLEVYHPEDREQVKGDVERTIRGESTSGVYRIVTPSGEVKWLNVSRRPLWDESHSQVIRYYGVAQDITAQKLAEEAQIEQSRLEFLLQKERELNTIQSSLIMEISHDFRTPLAMILTSSEMLERYSDRLSHEQIQEKLAGIRHQIRHLTAMLDEITQVASRGERFQPEPGNLEQLCQVSVKEMHDTVGSLHQFHFTTDGCLKEVQFDENLVSRILVNLLTNAVKYSPENSEIWLDARREGDQIRLTIVDQGIGISPEDLPHIFSPFFRASRVRAISGTGLGLSIVKGCVELHGGTIQVQSELNRGTTFTICLPYISTC